MRGLRLLLASAAVSITGDGALIAAAPLMAATLTRDPFQIALVAGAGYAAWLVAGLPAGALVDRWDRRRVMVTADLFRAVVLIGLVVAFIAGVANIWALIITVLLVGLGACFFDPASQSLIPDLAGKERASLDRANGFLWGIDNFGRSLSGPPVGALAFAWIRTLPFALDAVSFTISALLIKAIPKERDHRAEHPPVLRSIQSGVRFMADHAELRRLTLGMGAYNFAWNLGFATLVLFAQDVLGLGAVGYGLLIATGAVGGIMSGWLTPKLAGRLSAMTVYAIALVVRAAVWIVVAATTLPAFAGLAILVLGALSTGVSVVGGTARQLLAPADMLGRVVSVTRLVGIGSAALGAIAGGTVSHAMQHIGHRISLQAPMVVAAGFALVLSGLFVVFARSTKAV